MFLICWVDLSGQSSAELQREQLRLQKKIALTNKYLEDTRADKAKTLDQFKIVEKQVKNRESMLKNISSQLEKTTTEISKKEELLQTLTDKHASVRETYGSLLRSSYKQSLSINKAIYVLSSSSMKEAFLRSQYNRQLKDYTLQKSRLIQEQKDSIVSLLEDIQKEKDKKEKLLIESGKQKEKLNLELGKQNKALKSIEKNENELLKELKAQNRQKDKLAELIRIAISREIANSTSDDHTSVELSSRFSDNKGRLPWPVKNAVISKSFGTRTHPTNANVKIDNDGIDILTEPGGVVKSVFDGRVTSINQIPGFYNVVIVKVGEYFMVYGRLQSLQIKAGDIVSRGQTLGILAVEEDKSELQLQIWKGQTKLNPALWLKRK